VGDSTLVSAGLRGVNWTTSERKSDASGNHYTDGRWHRILASMRFWRSSNRGTYHKWTLWLFPDAWSECTSCFIPTGSVRLVRRKWSCSLITRMTTKQNSVIRSKSNIFRPPKFLGWLRYWSHSQSHTNNGFFKFVEALLQIHSCFFSHSVKLRGLPPLAVTISLNYLPKMIEFPSHMRQNACSSNWQGCQIQMNKKFQTAHQKMPNNF